MSAGDPWLSVLMPVFNGAGYLEAALESIRSEGPSGIEIVAADDGSTDGTLDVLRRYQSLLPLRIIHRGKDGNWATGVNRALREATARHACILCHDDIWLPGRLRFLLHALEIDPAPALVFHSALFIGPAGQRLGKWRCPFPRREGLLPREAVLERLLIQNFIASPAPMFDRKAALDSGGLDPSLWYTADWDLWLRLATRGPIVYSPEPLAAFRIHSASLTASRPRSDAEFRQQMQAVLDRHLPSVPAAARPRVAAEGGFSVDLNAMLAAAAHGRGLPGPGMAGRFLRLGPGGWMRYLRDSRVLERAGARVRLQLSR